MKHALIYTKKLEGAGLTREQAQAHLKILEEIVDGDMATKTDVQNVKIDLKIEMKMMEQRIVLKMGVMLVAAVGFMSALYALVH
jgi:hypothetical protein